MQSPSKALQAAVKQSVHGKSQTVGTGSPLVGVVIVMEVPLLKPVCCACGQQHQPARSLQPGVLLHVVQQAVTSP